MAIATRKQVTVCSTERSQNFHPTRDTLESMRDSFILLVGESAFLAAFVAQYGHLATGTLDISSLAPGIAPLQQQQPDVILVQAQYLHSHLGMLLQEKGNLPWLYCIAIANSSFDADPALDREQQLIEEAEALENGADAYLRLAPWGQPQTERSQREKRLLEVQIQVGASKAQQYRDLMQSYNVLSAIALIDPLTAINNRRAFESELPQRIQQAREQDLPLCTIMLDVDRFKAINDNYSHLVGDRVLQLLAARLGHQLRPEDAIFRYGGEEFVILLQSAPIEAARWIAERLRRSIREQLFCLEDGLSLPITISLGVACLSPEDDPDGMSLLSRADGYLLQAKAKGRDRAIGDGFSGELTADKLMNSGEGGF